MVTVWDLSNRYLNLPWSFKRMAYQCRWLSQSREEQNKVGILPEGWQMKALLEVNYSSFEVITATTGISQPIAHLIDIIWNKWHWKGCLCVIQIPNRWLETSKRGQYIGRNIIHGLINKVSTLGHLSICEGQSQLSKTVCLEWTDMMEIKFNHELTMLLNSCSWWIQRFCATHCSSENRKDALPYVPIP